MLQDTDCGRVERLRAELRAIELWDEAYWRSSHHEWWEKVALENRGRRRNEILRELQIIPDGILSLP